MATCTTYYALEIHGGSRVWAIDRPVQKGRVYVFHRFPDGVYTSIAASEVEKVDEQTEAPPSARFAPGQAIYVGPTLPSYAAPTAPPPSAVAADTVVIDSGSGYSDYGYWGSGYWGGGGWVPPRPQPPSPGAPTRIGPNGFPILAPPGSPGSVPPPIGSNGFPALAPQAPAPSPRRPQ